MSEPLPPPPGDLIDGASLYLDFDGTLVEIAATPDGVVVEPLVATLLAGLSARLGGRVALISGRAIDTLAGLVPVVAALMLLTEAALSVLGLGVQPPDASWGTLIADGQALLRERPLVAVAPGVMVAATVLALNAIASAIRAEG